MLSFIALVLMATALSSTWILAKKRQIKLLRAMDLEEREDYIKHKYVPGPYVPGPKVERMEEIFCCG